MLFEKTGEDLRGFKGSKEDSAEFIGILDSKMVRMRGGRSSAISFKCEAITSNSYVSVLTDKSSSKVICSPDSVNDVTGHSASRSFKIYTRRRCEDNSGKALPVSKVIASPAYEESHETGPLVASPSTCIASPASQESHATGSLVASSSTCIVSQSLDALHGNGRKEGYYFRGMASAKISCRTGAENDPRSRLQRHITDLLKAAGWLVKRHTILGKNSLESKYTSPTGRAFREFHNVWKRCGELLLGDRYVLVEDDDGLLWVDVGSFFSDLHDTLSNIEKEQQSESFISLAHWWNLLDPFVTVISIDKQIGLLRNGEAVKARRRWLTDKDEKRKVVLDLKQGCEKKWGRPIALGHELEIYERRTIVLALSRGGADVDQLTKGQIPLALSDSPHPSEHETTDDGCHTNALTNQLGPNCFLRYTCQGTEGKMELLPEKSICGCNGDDKVELDREAAKCWNKVESENPMPLAVYSEDANAFPDSCFDHESDKVRRYLLAAQDNCLNNCCSLVPEYCKSLVPVDLDDESNHPKILLNQEERTSVFRARKSTQQTVPSEKERLHRHSPDFIVKRKVRRKSKKISELKSIELHEDLILGRDYGKAELLDVGTTSSQTELGQVQEATDARTPSSCWSSPLRSSKPHIKKTRAKHKKARLNCGDSKWGDKRHKKCEIEDDDLLVSAIIRTKGLNESTATAITKTKLYKSRARKMMKSKVGRCRLLPRHLVKGSKLSIDRKWPVVGPRTVLSWLINSGIIMLDDVIQYRDSDKKSVIKDGRVAMEGISCNCCKKKLSLTQFKVHAGFKLSRPCLNLFMDSGEPFTLSELRAWSSEYKTRKSVNQTSQSNHFDQNDDSCGLCGDGGELICCDNCPSTYHRACLLTEDLPDGNWYCSNCTCQICGCLVIASSVDARKCFQCEHKYHESCVNLANVVRVASDAWFCGANCQQVYIGLHSRIGTTNHIADGYSWTLLRCIHDDQKVHSAYRFAVKAECNLKLAVALSIMEECFTSMVDPRTGIDMIPHLLYNWGSDFARLNFLGFYTVILDKDDELITVATIRVHGAALAEMPLVATCSKFRRQGMCRRIMAAIEELLMSIKVEKLVIASIPETVETWTKGFGFKVMEKDEKESLKRLNLMVLPGTVLLTKTLFPRLIADSEAGLVGGEDNLSPSTTGSTSRSDLLDNLSPSETRPPTSTINVAQSKLHRNHASSPLKHDGTVADDSQVIESPVEEPRSNLEELDVIEECAAGEQDTAETLEIDSQEDPIRIESKQHQTEKERRMKRKKAVKRKKASKRNKFAEEFWMPTSWGVVCGLHAVSTVNKEEQDTQ